MLATAGSPNDLVSHASAPSSVGTNQRAYPYDRFEHISVDILYELMIFPSIGENLHSVRLDLAAKGDHAQ